MYIYRLVILNTKHQFKYSFYLRVDAIGMILQRNKSYSIQFLNIWQKMIEVLVTYGITVKLNVNATYLFIGNVKFHIGICGVFMKYAVIVAGYCAYEN